MTGIILALDTSNPEMAYGLVFKTQDLVDIYKVGPQFFFAAVKHDYYRFDEFLRNNRIFFDFKFDDIPNTMTKAVRELLEYDPEMITVHLTAGPIAMRECLRPLTGLKTKLLGITVVTSIDYLDWKTIGLNDNLLETILDLVNNAHRWGMHGIVCDNEVSEYVKNKNMLVVVPGFRMDDDDFNDQKRVVIPTTLDKKNVDYIVVGRSVLKSADPIARLEKINSLLADTANTHLV